MSAETLRDYFIAHAPAVPQPWFKPVVPAQPAPAPMRPIDWTAEENEHYDSWREDCRELVDIKSQRVQAYIASVTAAREARQAWADLCERETFLQWPGAWADEMVSRRPQP